MLTPCYLLHSYFYFLVMTIIVTFFIAFIILFFERSGIRTLIIEKSKNKIISELFQCDFCLSFWLSLIAFSLLILVEKDFIFTIGPFISTPVIRHFL